MNISQFIFLIICSVKVIVLVTSSSLALGRRVEAVQIRWVVFGAALLLLFDLLILFQAVILFDFHIFWSAGRDVWSGIDPYSPARFATNPFLHPPTALPLFALFALLPFSPSFIIWTLLNVLVCLALPIYCQWILTAQERIGSAMGLESVALRSLSRSEIVIIMAVFAVSDAFVRGIYLGQLGIFTAFALISALGAQARDRPILAGVCLALATIKVNTMLPFLLLFHRKADLQAWIAMGCVCLGLCLATGRPGELPGRLSNMVHRIEALGAPGKVNDYSFQGPQNASLIGFDHLYYCLGLRERPLIRFLQFFTVAILGLWIAWQVIITRRSRGASCSLVALYSIVFLYHRDYDTIILVLPLVYCACRARAESGTAQYLFSSCVVAIYLILFLNFPLITFLTVKSLQWQVVGRIIQVILLPYATWLVLLVMAGLALADSLTMRTKASPLST